MSEVFMNCCYKNQALCFAYKSDFQVLFNLGKIRKIVIKYPENYMLPYITTMNK